MNRFKKGFLVCFSFAFFGTVSLYYNFILFPFVNMTEKDPQKRLDRLSDIVFKSWRWFVRYLIKIKIIDINIKNPEKLEKIKNSIIVPTHTSYIDVLVLIALIPKTTCFVAPKLGRNMFFTNIVKSAFLVSGKSVEEFTEDSKKMLESGLNLIIFPSGTRHAKGEIPKLHKGASLVALNTKKDIVPIKIYPNDDFLVIHKPIYDCGKTTTIFDIEVLDTIKTSDFLNIEDEITAKKNLRKKLKEDYTLIFKIQD